MSKTLASSISTAAIDYGDVARLGVILPSGNVVAECEIGAMLPAGVSAHFTRLRLRGSSVEDLQEMTAGVEDAAALLADANVDHIIFHCTAVTTFDADAGRRISARISAASGIKSFSTSEAIVAAFRAFDARRSVLISPYVEDIHDREKRFLNAYGIEVVRDGRMGVGPVETLGRLPPGAFRDLTIENASVDADMYFLSCTAVRTAGLIGSLETALSKPVITSNQVMLWYALQLSGLTCSAVPFGMLFTKNIQSSLSLTYQRCASEIR
jgi:maleate cis-trans isomerase